MQLFGGSSYYVFGQRWIVWLENSRFWSIPLLAIRRLVRVVDISSAQCLEL